MIKYARVEVKSPCTNHGTCDPTSGKMHMRDSVGPVPKTAPPAAVSGPGSDCFISCIKGDCSR